MTGAFAHLHSLQRALFIEIGGNGRRAREISLESSFYTKPGSNLRSTAWVKHYSRSPQVSTSPCASKATLSREGDRRR